MKNKRYRVWVHSDLQLYNVQLADEVLSRSIRDLQELDLRLDEVWCLGDAVCGGNEAVLAAVAQKNLHHLCRLNVPILYAMGNHEMDVKRLNGRYRFFLHELASSHPMWNMAPLDFPYLLRQLGETLVVLMGDHASESQGWWTAQGLINGEKKNYPHLPETYRQLRRIIEKHKGPVITASHYALPGGQRSSALLGHLLPLAPNVCLHLHGHAHIGDLVHNSERPWQRKNPIDGASLPQFNISALENVRSPGSHSAIVEFGGSEPISLRIRCHEKRAWLKQYSVPYLHPLSTA